MLALIAYDDCAYLLDEKPEHLRLMGILGNNAAILLYPAVKAMQKEMEEKKYADIRHLLAKGISISTIAEELHVSANEISLVKELL